MSLVVRSAGCQERARGRTRERRSRRGGAMLGGEVAWNSGRGRVWLIYRPRWGDAGTGGVQSLNLPPI